jgi:hypothetical protein
MENRCWYLDATVMWGLSSTQTWVLWKFTIPSLVNPASSVNRMLATHFVFTKHFGRSHWQNPALARRSRGVRACPRWMWYRLSDCSWRVLRTRGKPIPSAATILRTLVPGSSSTLLNRQTSRKFAPTSAGIYFWTYVHWDGFVHLSEYCILLKPVACLFNILYMVLPTLCFRYYNMLLLLNCLGVSWYILF